MAESTKEKMVTIMIDKRTGGLRTNGKLYVGKVTVREDIADDLIRRQNEYLATLDKINDPSVKLRNQSIEVTRKAFIADPSVFGNHPQFSKVNGMCDPFQLQFISPVDLDEWKAERLGLYGY
jgi:predicted glycosyltransferase